MKRNAVATKLTFTNLLVFSCAALVSVGIVSSTSAENHAKPTSTREKAIAYFDATYDGECQPNSETQWVFDGDDTKNPRRFELTYSSIYGQPDDKPETAIIYEFFCTSGAYNQQYVYIKANEVSFTPLTFAKPELDIKYADGSSDQVVESIKIAGFASYPSTVNPKFDPDTLTLLEFSAWRGLGDAYSKLTYQFSEGQFVLKRVEVDASYDGKMEPQLVVDYGNPAGGSQ